MLLLPHCSCYCLLPPGYCYCLLSPTPTTATATLLLLLPAATDSYCYCLQVFEGELIQKLGELFADAGLVAMVNRCGQVGRQAGRQGVEHTQAGRQAGLALRGSAYKQHGCMQAAGCLPGSSGGRGSRKDQGRIH